MVVRYWFLKEVFRQKKFTEDVVRLQKINIAGAIIGIMSALGISMVANFQVCYSSLVIPHLGIQKSLKIPKVKTTGLTMCPHDIKRQQDYQWSTLYKKTTGLAMVHTM